MVLDSVGEAPGVNGEPMEPTLYERYATAATSLVLRVSHDVTAPAGRVATEVVPSDDGYLHVEVLPGYLCPDPASQVELALADLGERFVVEAKVFLGEDALDCDDAGVAMPPAVVRFSVPVGLSGLSLECGRGPLALHSLDCAQLAVFSVAGDVSLVSCGGFVVVSVGRGSMYLEDVDGEANCSIGSGNVDVRSCRGRLRLYAGSGDVTADGFIGSVLSAESGQGSVSLAESLAESLTAKVKHGQVALSAISTAALSVAVGVGGCVCSGELAEGTHVLTVERGDLAIELPADAPLRFDLATGAGEITCPLPSVQVGRRGRPSTRGQRLVGVRGPGSVHLTASVGRGDLELRLSPPGA